MVNLLKYLNKGEGSKFLFAKLGKNENHICLARNENELQKVLTENLGDVKFIGMFDSFNVAKFEANGLEVLVSWTAMNWTDALAGKFHAHKLAKEFGFHFISRTEGGHSTIITSEDAIDEIRSSDIKKVGDKYHLNNIVFEICDFDTFNKNCLSGFPSKVEMSKVEF